MPRFKFSDQEWMSYAKSFDIPHLNDWIHLQVSRGRRYYISRVDQVGLTGRRALDAGAGMGNWTLALAERFESVVATEVDQERLAILEGIVDRFNGCIETQIAANEELPFDDGEFDAIFCNGVIFVTDVKKSLSEFARVLEPGGRLYVTFAGKAWWRHLLFERSLIEPNSLVYGSNGRLYYLFRLLDSFGLEALVPESLRSTLKSELVRSFSTNWPAWTTQGAVKKAYCSYSNSATDDSRRDEPERLVLTGVREILNRQYQEPPRRNMAKNVLQAISDLTEETVPISYRQRIYRDLISRCLFQHSDYDVEIQTHSYEPEEFCVELVSFGFEGIETAHEGCLNFRPSRKMVKPIYDRKLGVFEAKAQKPPADTNLSCSSAVSQSEIG